MGKSDAAFPQVMIVEPQGLAVPLNLPKARARARLYLPFLWKYKFLHEKNCLVHYLWDRACQLLEAAGCRRCRGVLLQMEELLGQIVEGLGEETTLAALEDLCRESLAAPCCPQSRGVARQVASALQNFQEIFLLHVRNKYCPAGVCPKLLPFPVLRPQKRRRVPFQVIPALEKIANHRTPVPMLDLELRKTTFMPVELGWSDVQAVKEAQRCLRCDVCIRCGACERACWQMGVNALRFSPISDIERILTGYQHAQQTCIACGACAIACPTQAIDYQEGEGFREVRLCGTVLNRLETAKCQNCGEPLPPARYLQYVTDRSDAAMDKHVLRRFCPRCARKKRAASFVKL
jgi:ferredoxin